MTATRDGRSLDTPSGVHPGRYGRSADARADRTLRIVGAVLGAALVALVGWFGVSYVSGQDVSGELIKYRVVSDGAVQVHVEVRKDEDVDGVCTLRALDEAKGEVGRKDVAFDRRLSRIDQVVTLRTTRRATAVELIGCKAAAG